MQSNANTLEQEKLVNRFVERFGPDTDCSFTFFKGYLVRVSEDWIWFQYSIEVLEDLLERNEPLSYILSFNLETNDEPTEEEEVADSFYAAYRLNEPLTEEEKAEMTRKIVGGLVGSYNVILSPKEAREARLHPSFEGNYSACVRGVRGMLDDFHDEQASESLPKLESEPMS
jgi:hypothetical protein